MQYYKYKAFSNRYLNLGYLARIYLISRKSLTIDYLSYHLPYVCPSKQWLCYVRLNRDSLLYHKAQLNNLRILLLNTHVKHVYIYYCMLLTSLSSVAWGTIIRIEIEYTERCQIHYHIIFAEHDQCNLLLSEICKSVIVQSDRYYNIISCNRNPCKAASFNRQ